MPILFHKHLDVRNLMLLPPLHTPRIYKISTNPRAELLCDATHFPGDESDLLIAMKTAFWNYFNLAVTTMAVAPPNFNPHIVHWLEARPSDRALCFRAGKLLFYVTMVSRSSHKRKDNARAFQKLSAN